jgi:hypothetical protein
MSWNEDDFLERLGPHLRDRSDARVDACPDADVLCALVDNPEQVAHQGPVMEHVRRCSACSTLYTHLQRFGRTDTPHDAPDWENAEKRLDLWAKSLPLMRGTAPARVRQQRSEVERRSRRNRRWDWLRATPSQWVVGTGIGLTGLVAVVLVLNVWPDFFRRLMPDAVEQSAHQAGHSGVEPPVNSETQVPLASDQVALPLALSEAGRPAPEPTPARIGMGRAASWPRVSGPTIVQAVIRKGSTTLELAPGRLYLYGLATDGGAATTAFAAGEVAQAANPARQLSAALAYGTDPRNSYTTETAVHAIGGVSVTGSWTTVTAFRRSGPPPMGSVSFTVSGDALVVVIGLGANQQYLALGGLPGLTTDAENQGDGAEAMVIAHAAVGAGRYTVTETTRAVGGQDPTHMVDLIGVFVFVR